MSDHTGTAPFEDSYSVPIRRSAWISFGIGVLAVILSASLAAALVGVPMILDIYLGDGAVILVVFSVLWFSLFFLSYPLQKRCARLMDMRCPGIRLEDGLLTIPVTASVTMRFRMDESLGLKFGWFESATPNERGGRTRWFMTYAILSQAGQQILLKAEHSAEEAQAAGWLNSTDSATPSRSVHLWASDLVRLVEVMRAQLRSIVPTDLVNARREWR